MQDTGVLFRQPSLAPNSELYKASWDMPLAKSLTQPFDAPGRPKAHHEFNEMWSYVLGRIPPEEDRWRRFGDFYVNSLSGISAYETEMAG